MIFNEYEEEFTKEEFDNTYRIIFNNLISSNPTKEGKCAYILGGQPGAGKSSFYSGNESLNEYVIVDGDQYRKFHPHYKDIVKYDIENYASRTQSFVNQVVNQLITDLGKDGYNIIIEGTLKDPKIPIKTCNQLNRLGYKTNLVVIACDAETSWKATISRAKIMQQMGQKPRFVPIDKYNMIVNNIVKSLSVIEKNKCFDNISVIDRNNNMLYTYGDKGDASTILQKELNLSNWNKKYSIYAREFMDEKIKMIKKEQDDIRE